MRINAQFMTVEMKAFLKMQKIVITQQIPHENSSIEVLIKHTQEDVNKSLQSSKLIDENWKLAVIDATDLREQLSSAMNPLA